MNMQTFSDDSTPFDLSDDEDDGINFNNEKIPLPSQKNKMIQQNNQQGNQKGKRPGNANKITKKRDPFAIDESSGNPDDFFLFNSESSHSNSPKNQTHQQSYNNFQNTSQNANNNLQSNKLNNNSFNSNSLSNNNNPNLNNNNLTNNLNNNKNKTTNMNLNSNNNFGNKINNINNANQQYFQNTSSPKSFEDIENHLLQYLDISISKIRSSFSDELAYLLNKESEEESAISAFILGLPHEIDDMISKEIEGLPDFPIKSYNIDTLLSPLDDLDHIFPQHTGIERNEVENLDILIDDIQKLNINMKNSISSSISTIQRENQELCKSRQDYCYSTQNQDITPEVHSFMTLCEKDAEKTKLDIEYEAIMKQKRKIEEMKIQYDQKLLEFEKEKEREKMDFEKEFSILANEVKDSQFCQALGTLKLLVDTAKSNFAELKVIRKEMEKEIENFGYLQTGMKMNYSQNNAFSINENVEEQLRTFRKQRAQAFKSIENL